MENTDKPKNTKPQIFRDTANDEEWKKLVELALSTNPIGTKVPDEYGFSWSAIRSDAVERGYYEPKRRLAPTSIPDTPVTVLVKLFGNTLFGNHALYRNSIGVI